MGPEMASGLGGVLLGFFIALPALGAWMRRRRSRDSSALADELSSYAAQVRTAARALPLCDALKKKLRTLAGNEGATLRLADELGAADHRLLADAAQRLSLRLRRRVAFERKMLARTAPGLRRGAIAALAPILIALALQMMGLGLPAGTLLALALVELAGCLLLWRLARVEI